MEYKVIPFYPSISSSGSLDNVATDFENLILNEAETGWKYVRVEKLTTFVQGSSGCFGFGATPGFHKTLHLVVFKK